MGAQSFVPVTNFKLVTSANVVNQFGRRVEARPCVVLSNQRSKGGLQIRPGVVLSNQRSKGRLQIFLGEICGQCVVSRQCVVSQHCDVEDPLNPSLWAAVMSIQVGLWLQNKSRSLAPVAVMTVTIRDGQTDQGTWTNI